MTLVILIIVVLIIIVIAALLVQSPRAARPQLEVFTLPEAARYLKISEQDVLQLIRSGELRARRIGSEYRIHRDRLDEIPQEWLHPGSS
ncbi:MAG: helix-turn-helix domain-containing protein [Anaerolineae bacterium]|nr:helix-turn-helix domain-containing protein [Anaerolineae bacterium]